jgi:hypothetical protein
MPGPRSRSRCAHRAPGLARTTRFAYKVTTQTEFDETLAQLFGSGSAGGSPSTRCWPHGLPAGTRQPGRHRAGSAAADKLVKFVNKVIIDAYNQKVRHPHRADAGKAKTGIRFRIDGTRSPTLKYPHSSARRW